MDQAARLQHCHRKKRKSSRLSWHKSCRKIKETLHKRVEEEKLFLTNSSDQDVDILNCSTENKEEQSDMEVENLNESFNFTIKHNETSEMPNMADNNPNGRNFNARFLHRCCNLFGNNPTMDNLLRKMDEEQLLPHFMAFVNGICDGTISVCNISILLALEYCYLMSLINTTKMRYREETCKFWECAQFLGGSRLMRLFGSDKHYGKVNERQCEKSKYHPHMGNFNFAVPDKKFFVNPRRKSPQLFHVV